MHKQTGFTLIELMVVVAIIGILASIAMSNYQNFYVKVQTTEAIVLLGSAKTNIEDTTVINGEFPQTVIALAAINTQTSGTYGTLTGTANTTSNLSSGDVIYKFSSTGVNNNLKSKSVWYTRSIDGSWSCKTNLATRYSPKACIYNQSVPSGT